MNVYKYRRYLLGGITLIMYFFIAYWANNDKGNVAAMKAGIVQAMVSMCLVLVSSWLMEFFFKFGKTLLQKYCASIFLTGSMLFIVNYMAHYVMGTPNLLKTVIYAAIMAMPYYFIYPFFLVKHSIHQRNNNTAN